MILEIVISIIDTNKGTTIQWFFRNHSFVTMKNFKSGGKVWQIRAAFELTLAKKKKLADLAWRNSPDIKAASEIFALLCDLDSNFHDDWTIEEVQVHFVQKYACYFLLVIVVILFCKGYLWRCRNWRPRTTAPGFLDRHGLYGAVSTIQWVSQLSDMRTGWISLRRSSGDSDEEERAIHYLGSLQN